MKRVHSFQWQIRSRISYLPEDDPKQRQPNIAKAREELGWEFKEPLEDGLEKTVEYFKELK